MFLYKLHSLEHICLKETDSFVYDYVSLDTSDLGFQIFVFIWMYRAGC